MTDDDYDDRSEQRYEGDDETERLRIVRWGFDVEPWEEPQQ